MKPADAKDDAKPPHEIEALDYFVGIWTCKGRVEATPTTPAHDTKGTMICRWELGKFYLGLAEDDEQSLKFPRRRQMRGYWGYDPGAKLYTSAVFFFGGGRFIGTSSGWRGDVLTFSGTMIAGGESFAMRQVVQAEERRRADHSCRRRRPRRHAREAPGRALPARRRRLTNPRGAPRRRRHRLPQPLLLRELFTG